MRQQLLSVGLLIMAMTNEAAKAQELEPALFQVKGDAPTVLYGSGASKLEGDIKKQGGDYFRWTGSGSLTWNVHVNKTGDYEVNLCQSGDSGSIGHQVQVSTGNSCVTNILAMTKGVFGEGFMAYEAIPFGGLLKLEAGNRTISLTITNAASGTHVIDFRRDRKSVA